jgi:hypothetical protein
MTDAHWRTDPDLVAGFHAQYPDDLQVIVHDGEPRRSKRGPEACWVRVSGVARRLRFPLLPAGAGAALSPEAATWAERTVYQGALLNQPHQLQSVAKGDPVTFIYSPGVPHPLRVVPAYLEERPVWAVKPCDKCGADQTFDPPTVMAATRFPAAAPGSAPVAFTAFCPCGGTMMLLSLAQAAPAQPEPAARPWWKIW